MAVRIAKVLPPPPQSAGLHLRVSSISGWKCAFRRRLSAGRVGFMARALLGPRGWGTRPGRPLIRSRDVGRPLRGRPSPPLSTADSGTLARRPGIITARFVILRHHPPPRLDPGHARPSRRRARHGSRPEEHPVELRDLVPLPPWRPAGRSSRRPRHNGSSGRPAPNGPSCAAEELPTSVDRHVAISSVESTSAHRSPPALAVARPSRSKASNRARYVKGRSTVT